MNRGKLGEEKYRKYGQGFVRTRHVSLDAGGRRIAGGHERVMAERMQ